MTPKRSHTVLTVRLAGSQSVAVGMPAFCVLLAAPTGHRLNFLPHFGSFLNEPQGMGPLDEPSQVLQPIAHLQETDALITSITQAAGLSGGGADTPFLGVFSWRPWLSFSIWL